MLLPLVLAWAACNDYPIDEKDTVAVLNELVAKTGVLLDIYARIKERFVTGQFA